MSDIAVAVRGFSKVFPAPFSRRVVVAVRDLNLEIKAGQIYGLLGPNGSGKSTTLKAILGLVPPTHGTTEIFGRDSSEVSSRAAVGFLPESPYFPRYLTGEEMLRFYGKLCGLPRRALENRTAELLDLVGLTSARARHIGTYSKGMLQRIGLAQALINDPKLLVLDEPAAAVDPAGTIHIRNIIIGLKERGVTVLLSSHLLGQVQELCDRVGILANGALVREGAIDELLSVGTESELVLENAPPDLLQELASLASRRGVRIIATRQRQRSLEELYLEATQGGSNH